ncbi:hypothetical protein LTS18_001022, partial [Coniosporium uncinatum]
RISGVSVHDGTILLYQNDQPAPAFRLDTLVLADSVNLRRVSELPPLVRTPHNEFDFFGTYRAIPLKSFHLHRPKDLSTGQPTDCVNTLLQVGFRLQEGHGTVAPPVSPCSTHTGAFLIKGCEEVQPCSQIDARNDWTVLTHRFVARLTNAPVSAARSTSQGFIVATSEQGTRIAIAAWTDVFLYAIDPGAFLEKNVGSGDQTKKGLKGSVEELVKAGRIRLKRPGEEDHAYMRKCGRPFYKGVDESMGLPRIKPTKLPLAGVVYTMEFVGEDHLWAWTDRGLVKWYWGAGRQGTREEYVL